MLAEDTIRPIYSVGARGGHGPSRYVVAAYVPGQSIRFRFTGPKGFDGYRGYEIAETLDALVLRHTLQMATRGARHTVLAAPAQTSSRRTNRGLASRRKGIARSTAKRTLMVAVGPVPSLGRIEWEGRLTGVHARPIELTGKPIVHW